MVAIIGIAELGENWTQQIFTSIPDMKTPFIQQVDRKVEQMLLLIECFYFKRISRQNW